MSKTERSWYLDDMHLREGDRVRAKATIGSLHLTAGKTYTVSLRDCGYRALVAGITNDAGNWVIPSARFQKEQNDGTMLYDDGSRRRDPAMA